MVSLAKKILKYVKVKRYHNSLLMLLLLQDWMKFNLSRIDSIKNFLANRKHILIMYIVLNRALSGHGFCNMFKNDDLYYSSVQKQSKFINGFLNTITISCLVTNWCHWKCLEFWMIKENWISNILSNHFLYFISSHSIHMHSFYFKANDIIEIVFEII